MDLGQIIEQLLSNKIYIGAGLTVTFGTIVVFLTTLLKSRGVKINLNKSFGSVGGVVSNLSKKVDSFQESISFIPETLTRMSDLLEVNLTTLRVIVTNLPIDKEQKVEIGKILDSTLLTNTKITEESKKAIELFNAKIDKMQEEIPNKIKEIEDDLTKPNKQTELVQEVKVINAEETETNIYDIK